MSRVQHQFPAPDEIFELMKFNKPELNVKELCRLHPVPRAGEQVS